MAATSLMGGCRLSHPEMALTQSQLVWRHNANASAVPRLWAKAHVALTLPNGLTVGSTSPLVAPNGTILLGKGDEPLGPHNFVLILRESGETIAQLGTNVEQNVYYLWHRAGERAGAWRGRLDLAGAAGVGIPIDPLSVLSVLAVTALPAEATTLPAVGLTFRPASWPAQPQSAYVLTYVDRQPVSGRILFRREALFNWSDDEPRPYRVNILDEYGRVVMTADLRDYKPIALPPGETGPAPVMPTDIRITWSAWAPPGKGGFVPMRPEAGTTSSLHLVLSDMTTQEKGDPALASEYRNPNVPETLVDAPLTMEGGSR